MVYEGILILAIWAVLVLDKQRNTKSNQKLITDEIGEKL